MNKLVELKKSELKEISGGGDDVFGGGWEANVGLAIATGFLFAAPFTGGITLGLLAFASFVIAARAAE